MREGQSSGDTWVWPEHEQGVAVFAALLTQWRIAPTRWQPMGEVIGLDYSAIPAALEMMGIERAGWPVLFEQVRVMENEAVRAMNE